MIPNFLSKQDEEGSKPTDVFAYISVEDVNHPSDKSKRLSGKIRKCNLTTSKLAAGVILKEVGCAKPPIAHIVCIDLLLLVIIMDI